MRGIPVGSSCVRNRGPGQSVFVYTGTSIGITAQKDQKLEDSRSKWYTRFADWAGPANADTTPPRYLA